MIVMDTNVVSELMQEVPTPQVVDWFAVQPPSDVFLCAVTEAELRYGVEILPLGRRRDNLAARMNRMLTRVLAGRILPFNSVAAQEYASIAASRRTAGRPIAPFDGQIAAIARSLGASVATRDTRGFEGCGVDLINPWAD